MAAWPFLSSGHSRYSNQKSYITCIFPIDCNGQVRCLRPETRFITNISTVDFKSVLIFLKNF